MKLKASKKKASLNFDEEFKKGISADEFKKKSHR
jgi:hypothetical protein